MFLNSGEVICILASASPINKQIHREKIVDKTINFHFVILILSVDNNFHLLLFYFIPGFIYVKKCFIKNGEMPSPQCSGSCLGYFLAGTLIFPQPGKISLACGASLCPIIYSRATVPARHPRTPRSKTPKPPANNSCARGISS